MTDMIRHHGPRAQFHRLVALSFGTALLAGCLDDGLLVTPAEQPRAMAPIALSLSGALGGPGEAYDQADAMHIVVHALDSLGAPVVLVDTTATINPAGGTQTRVSVAVPFEAGREQIVVEAMLLFQGQPLFTASSTAVLEEGATTPVVLVLEPVVADIVVSAASIEMNAIGDTFRVSGAAVFATGDTILDLPVVWSTRDETVATVDASGLVTGIANGTAWLIASIDVASDSIFVNVAQQFASLTVAAPRDTLAVGESMTATAAAFDANGSPMTAIFAWSSSDPSVASVDSTGRVTGAGIGSAYIRASSGGLADSVAVTVVAAPVDRFADPASYLTYIDEVYAGLAVGPDIPGSDPAFGQYTRAYWTLQELPTDVAVIAWTDPGLPQIVTSQWQSTNEPVAAMYSRIFTQIGLANDYLRETTDSAVAARGHTGVAGIPGYRAEARVLRALSYWHGMDLFGSIPLVTEANYGGPPPNQATRAEVFTFVESELLAAGAALPAVGGAAYGRLDQGAVAMLLAKLYLNAEVYGVAARYADALTQSQIVIGGPYSLDPVYQDVFRADNHTSPEIVFAVPFDGTTTQTYGGTTFITHAAVGGTMIPADYGIDFGWAGLRVTQQLVGLYEGGATGPDVRASLLYTNGQNLVVNTLTSFQDGFAYPKYSNVTSLGAAGSHPTFTDIDFPMFRLADAYLMYAEACLRSGGGACEATALSFVNAIRQRAYGATSGDITAAGLTLAFILDERARELAWEAHRRTDLIRYGLFTGGVYLWAFKGGSAAGQTTPTFLDLYPIPAAELAANSNLIQNPGY